MGSGDRGPPGRDVPSEVRDGTTRLPWGTSVLGVVHVSGRPRAVAAQVAAARAELAWLYGPVFGTPHIADTAVEPACAAVVAATAAPVSLEDVRYVVWGRPIGEHGDATDVEIARFAGRPGASTTLRGLFVVVDIGADAVRIVTTADTVHCLKRVRGTSAVAWATRGWCAHVLAGRRPRLREDTVAEYVLFDYVFGDSELLEDTVEIGDAAVVTVTAHRAQEASWWPLEERVTRTAPTRPQDLLAHLATTMRSVAAAPDVWLGLTAGRDSALLASMTAAAGASLTAFTMGDENSADVVGARAICDALGWRHHVIGVDDDGSAPWSRLLRATRWTEGLDTARNIAVPPPAVPKPEATWLAGSGGEMGRAFYWQGLDPSADPRDVMLARRTRLLSSRERSPIYDRVGQELARGRALDLSGPTLLDFFHARNRVRKWTGRVLPVVQDLVPGYVDPGTVNLLLNVSDDDRIGGKFFDRCHAAADVDLHRIATAGVTRHLSPPSDTAPRSNRVTRLARRFAPASLRRRDPAWDWTSYRAELEDALRRVTVARDIVGPRWWDAISRDAPYNATLRRQLWNALAVEALAAVLDGDD